MIDRKLQRSLVLPAGLLLALSLSSCASSPAPRAGQPPAAKNDRAAAEMPWREPHPYQSTYKPLPASPVLITNATILTAAGERMENASILLRDGKVAATGRSIEPVPDAIVVDGRGKWLTPGLIDVHSHLGVYPSPSVQGLSDGNESTNPNTAEVWAEHSVWPQDPQFALALAAGVTTIQILPGSANLFGGRV